MLTKDRMKIEKPETLLGLLAAYRKAPAPASLAGRRDLARMAAAIDRNCALTVQFTSRKLTNIDEENEEIYTLFAVREEAMALRRQCASLAGRRQGRILAEEVESLRRRYDNFTGSVKHLFHLLDRGLAGRLDGAL